MRENDDHSIPKISFGLCRWCGEENQRLQYLMCSSCFRIANMIPSKTMVLLNRPEIKKRLGPGGTTIRNITPELRRFIMDPKSRFPPEMSDREHWEIMRQEAADRVTQKDVRIYLEDMISRGVHELPPSDDELIALVGLEILLRFILHVGVIRGLLKIDIAGEEDFFSDICEECMKDTMQENPTQGLETDQPAQEFTRNEPRAGMKVRDLIMKKYGR